MIMETKPNSGNLQEPYTLRCVKPLEVLNDFYGEEDDAEEYLYIDAGTYWESSDSIPERDFRLYGKGKMEGWYIDLTADCLNEHFEVIHKVGHDERD